MRSLFLQHVVGKFHSFSHPLFPLARAWGTESLGPEILHGFQQSVSSSYSKPRRDRPSNVGDVITPPGD